MTATPATSNLMGGSSVFGSTGGLGMQSNHVSVMSQMIGTQASPFSAEKTKDNHSVMAYNFSTKYNCLPIKLMRLKDYMDIKSNQINPSLSQSIQQYILVGRGQAQAAPVPGGLFNLQATTTGNRPAGFGTNTTGGLFGNETSSTNGGLFGQSNNMGTTGGLFGQASNTAVPSGGLFGASAPSQPSGGLFGGAQAPAAGGLFGGGAPTNTAGGLFGGGAANTGGLFGGQTGQTQPQGNTGGLYGQQ